MPDFGTRWINPQKLEKGGQAQTYTVEDALNCGVQRVAKILDDPKGDRKARFLQEVEVTESFDHPNVVRSLGRGETKTHKWPFFVMPSYTLGTLENNHENLGSPLDRLRTFLKICNGVAYAHSKGLIHRDLKPANVFMAALDAPVVGDFGLCYRHEADPEERRTRSSEAVGARKYMPPEWREGRVDRPQAAGDIYSLGKLLYWMFVGREYDGHEDDHSTKERTIVETYWTAADERSSLQTAKAYHERWILAHSLADELVSKTLRKKAELRIDSAVKLAEQVQAAINRVQSDGRVLDLRLPKQCLFCGKGTYRAAHELSFHNYRGDIFPDLDKRRNPHAGQSSPQEPFKDLHDIANYYFGLAGRGTPLILVCDFCGNIQYFRLDLTADMKGESWRP